MPIKVAYVTSAYPAPSHTFIEREINELKKLGLDVETFSINRPAQAYLDSRQDRGAEAARTSYMLPIDIKRYARAHAKLFGMAPSRYLKTLRKAFSHSPEGVSHLVKAMAHFAEAIVMADELQKKNITHVHNHFANSSATVSYLATRYLERVKWSLTLHAHSETDFPACVTLPEKLKDADFVVAISMFMRAQAFRIMDQAQWRKVHNIGCGVDTKGIWETRKHIVERRLNLQKTSIVPYKFISVARLAAEKGHVGLFQAFANIAKNEPNVELVLVGSGPEQENLQKLSFKLGIQHKVRFLGALPEDQTLDQIADADCLVLGSFMEGIPVVMMEAVALNKDFIMPAVAGIPEVLNMMPQVMYPATDWEMLEMLMRMKHAFRGQRPKYDHTSWAARFDIKSKAQQLFDLFHRQNK